ncbi:hypothetical protein CTAM01_16065 [Colletotrichum tamarilloi]|uniref:SWIM-type domain-containing protein n=1 Tax=Colletotrichum tamarilloi TaxID=1209934 RepID=A0ABQ9QJQ2_9PEZI|nr:uncharacterized protein CTAM01_16065 [Colletotrichum tamarilloi]KAK1473850.1 hypothetical protein CTAM01_16065 [Colletotrichum tamarilloi]
MGKLLQACSHRFKVSIGIRGSVAGCCASSNGEASCPTSTQRLGIDGYGTSGAQIQGHGANRPLVDRIQARVWQSSYWASMSKQSKRVVGLCNLCGREMEGRADVFTRRWEHHPASKHPEQQNGDGRNSRDPVRLATSSRPAQKRASHGRFRQGNTVSDRYSAETPGLGTLSHLQNQCNCSCFFATLRLCDHPFVMAKSSTLIQDRPHEPLVTRP